MTKTRLEIMRPEPSSNQRNAAQLQSENEKRLRQQAEPQFGGIPVKK